MTLEALEDALRIGAKVRGFRSGGGLRVVRVEKDEKLLAYGEHPSVDEALEHANEDYLAGGRKYGKVYGTIHPHYLTGSSSSTGQLDEWVLKGNKFAAWRNGEVVVAELQGYAETKIPDQITAKVNRERIPVRWQNRGFTYETTTSQFPNGEPCVSTAVIESPKGVASADAWLYHIAKKGEGENLLQAIASAFTAVEVELIR